MLRNLPLRGGLIMMLATLLVRQVLPAQTGFYNQLPIPDTVQSTALTLLMVQENHNFDPGRVGNHALDSVNTFAFNALSGMAPNTFLGPTLLWNANVHQHITVQNNLGQRSSVHWHGAHVPAALDGGPHTTIASGGSKDHDFEVLDRSCTLWYHPHPHGDTYAHVNMGLAGIIIVRNSTHPGLEDSLPHRYNKDDFPIIVDSRNFKNCASGDCEIDTLQFGPGSGNPNQKLTPLVNGVVKPYLEVPPQLVRFRILDASARLSYQFGFSADSARTANETFLPFHIIAADAGYLEGVAPKADSFVTAPGIRTEVVVDFTGKANQKFYLRNLATGIPADVRTDVASTFGSFLEIRVTATPDPVLGQLPATFPTETPLQQGPNTVYRTKKLMPNINPVRNHSIDGTPFNMGIINDTIYLDDVEVWTVKNVSNMAHPFHIHDVSVKVLSVKWLKTDGTDSVAIDTTNATPMPWRNIRKIYYGPKDNMLVFKNQSVEFITKFEDFATPIDSSNAYMYHCHILTHEDGYYALGQPGNPTLHQREPFGMMHQFVVTTRPTGGVNPQILDKDVVLYPNPADDRLHLAGASAKPSTIRVFDLQGRTLLKQDLAPFDGVEDIDVSQIVPGMVLVEWQSATGKYVKKVLLQ